MNTKVGSSMKLFKKKLYAVRDIPLYVKFLSYLITTVLALSCIIPFLLTVAISFTDEEALRIYGYSLFPTKISFQAYEYVLRNGEQILRSYGVTIFVTVFGTLLGLLVMTLYAYVISRKCFVWKQQFSFFIFFTMLFSGGMLPSYIINSSVLHLKDTIGALILPMCISSMYILILRTYMQTAIPDSIEESAKIDGANDFLCYYKIILPMAIPSIATIALFLAVDYWNNWYLSFLYITSNNDIIPIQLLLKRIENNIQFLANSMGTMGAVERQTIQGTIPSETIRMCLVVVVVMPILIAYPFFQRFFVKGITVGAIKG